MRHAALLGAVAVLISACGFLPPPGWVTDREPLESCGTEDVAQGGNHRGWMRGGPNPVRAVVGVAVLLGMAGCSSFYPPDQPDWIVNRIPLESCGVETIGGAGIPLNLDARTCLLAAFQAGEGAELISTRASEEGDPITTYYRVHENGTVEIFVDATRDRLGSQRWERYRCDRLASSDDVHPDLANEERVFVEEGCEELPIP
jgi:hypothetical protein